MDFDEFQDALSDKFDELYSEGRLTHIRGIIVRRSLYDEIASENSDFSNKITAKFDRGTREVTFTFYVLASDNMPWDEDFLLTGQTEEHYRQYYLGHESDLWYQTYSRSLDILGCDFDVTELSTISGGIQLADGSVLPDIPFETVLEIAGRIADTLAERGDDYRVSKDFLALLKSADWSDDPQRSTYTISDSKYYERQTAYNAFCSALEAEIRKLFKSENLVLNEPHASWNDTPSSYSMEEARLESDIYNDTDPPSSALGCLLMESHKIMDPPALSISGVYIDGHGTLRLYSVPLFAEGGMNIYYTQDHRQFLEIASRYFFPQEVREFLMKLGIKISLKEIRALKQTIVEDWNSLPDLSEAGKITILDSGSVGILSVCFRTTRGLLTDPFDIVYADTRNEWVRVKNEYFPSRWSGYPPDDDDDEEFLCELDFM